MKEIHSQDKQLCRNDTQPWWSLRKPRFFLTNQNAFVVLDCL